MLAVFAVGEVFLSMLWFFLFLMWILLLFRVFGDIFRSTDLSGAMKVLWLLFVIVTPYLGVFVYVIARGRRMTEHEIARVEANEEAFRSYVRTAAGTSASKADELARLADLRDRGVIDATEFVTLKSAVIG